MTRGCVIANCGRTPAPKAVCCGLKLCETHASSVKAHACPRVAELNAMTKAQRRALLTGEEGITPELVDALNKLPEIEMAWQSRKRGGVRANDAARAVADVTFIARGGLHGEVELKGSHKDSCPCDSCAAQRDRGERVRGAGGIYVAGVRTVQQGVDVVRVAISLARIAAPNQEQTREALREALPDPQLLVVCDHSPEFPHPLNEGGMVCKHPREELP